LKIQSSISNQSIIELKIMTEHVSAELIDGTKISSAHDLPVGLSEIRQGTVYGYKFFTDCTTEQTWADWLVGRSHGTYSLCFSKVAVNPGNQILRPSEFYCDKYDHTDCGNRPSDDMRTNEIVIGEIVTPCGKKCTSAMSPFRKFKFTPNTTYRGELNKQIDEIRAPGFHFYPSTRELRENVLPEYSCTTIFGERFCPTPRSLDS
jgi:hypothetical protein